MDYKETAPSIPAQSGNGTTTIVRTSRVSKDNDFSCDAKRDKQLSVIIEAFSDSPRTMLQVAKKTGIERASICRRVCTLRKERRIFLCGKRACPISHRRAGYYTTSPKVAFHYYARWCAPLISGLRSWEKTLIRKCIAMMVYDGTTALEAQNHLPIDLWGYWIKCSSIIKQEGEL